MKWMVQLFFYGQNLDRDTQLMHFFFLNVFDEFWKLYVNSVMKIQPWACDTLLENSSVKIILMKDNRMFTELYIQLN